MKGPITEDQRILLGVLRTELAAQAYYEEMLRLIEGTPYERFRNEIKAMVDEEREHARLAMEHLTRLRNADLSSWP